MWYIWKAKNDKMYSNVNRDPQITLKIAESEAAIWEEAQRSEQELVSQNIITPPLTSDYAGWWCYIDGSWKEMDRSSGLGWHYFQEGVEETIL